MYLTCIKKEILSNILSLRYAIISILFVILILVSTILRTHLYKKQVRDYQNAVKERYKLMEEVTSSWRSKELGIAVEKEPNPLSIFAFGLENEITRSFSISGWAPPETGKRKLNNPSFQYFLQLDMVLIVNIICSLLALLLVYDSICGEKEQGTLKILLAGPLPRDAIIVSKLVAGLITLLSPFLISFVLSLIYATVIGKIAFGAQEYAQLAWIGLLSVVYLCFFFALGTSISSLVHKSATAMVWCLFLWVAIVLGVPNLVPMVVKHFSPIPPQSKIVMEKEAERKYVRKVLGAKWRKEMSEDAQFTTLHEMLEEQRRREREEIAKRNTRIDKFYNDRIIRQATLNQQFSRISPSAGYIFAATQVAGTGVRDFLNLLNYVDEFKAAYLEKQKEQEKIAKKKREEQEARKVKREDIVDAYDPSLWPEFRPPRMDVTRALNHSIADIIIIVFLSVIFFLVSFIGFMRYNPT